MSGLVSGIFGAARISPGQLPSATETAIGAVELATNAENVTGTDPNRATTPAGMTARLAAPGAIGGTTKSPSIGAEVIQFPATQVPSADPNAFDDYEEGNWTPVFNFATPGDLSVAYSKQLGTYTKTGRLVKITNDVSSSSFTHSTASGNFQIDGIPFTPPAGIDFTGSTTFRGVTKAGYTQVTAKIAASTSHVRFPASASALASSNVTAADMPTGGTLQFNTAISYEV